MKKLKKDIEEGKIVTGFITYFRRHAILWAYLLLAGIVALCFWTYERDRKERRQQIVAAVAINCERLNRISDQKAEEIYKNWRDLKRHAELLDIPLSAKLKSQVIINSNQDLKQLKYYDCTHPPELPEKFRSYELISLGKPIPTLPKRDEHR